MNAQNSNLVKKKIIREKAARFMLRQKNVILSDKVLNFERYF